MDNGAEVHAETGSSKEESASTSPRTLQNKPLASVANKPASRAAPMATTTATVSRAITLPYATPPIVTAEASGPVMNPVNNTINQPLWPVLHLLPINDTFIPKQIFLAPPGNRIKIGRQTNAKTVPAPNNGYFDSKVLSRTHAEVWFEPHMPDQEGEVAPPGGRVFVKDVGSSNGTFINGERLSVESVKSDVFELHSDDTVEFGIDIASEDGRNILHHKVATKVHLALTQEDAQVMARQLSALHQKMHSEVGMRRMSRAGVASTGLSFDHILSRLQSELQKSRETSHDLNLLNSTMSDVHATLGGHVPAPPLPTFPRVPHLHTNGNNANVQASNIAALQTQINDTQATFQSQMDKLKQLEGLVDQHENVRREVTDLKEQMRIAKSELELLAAAKSSAFARQFSASMDQNTNHSSTGLELMLQADGDDDDDARSVASVGTIRGAPEIDEDFDLPEDSSFRPRSPPKTNGVLPHSSKEDVDQPTPAELHSQNVALTSKLETLSTELANATHLSKTLQEQHSEAASIMKRLEERIVTLEAALEPTSPKDAAVEAKPELDVKAFEAKWETWRTTFEAAWRKDRENWEAERTKLQQIIAAWEAREAQRLVDEAAHAEHIAKLERELEASLAQKASRRRPRSKRRRKAAHADDAEPDQDSDTVSSGSDEEVDAFEADQSPVDTMRDVPSKGADSAATRRNTITPNTALLLRHGDSDKAHARQDSKTSTDEDLTANLWSAASRAQGKPLDKKTFAPSSGPVTTAGALVVAALALAVWHVSSKD